MDRSGFRTYLESRKLPENDIEQHLALVERFETFINLPADIAPPRPLTAQDARAFIAILKAKCQDSLENILALARYGWFSGNRPMYLVCLELLDGGEVMNNLYAKLAEVAGEDKRDQIFAGVELPSWGTPNIAKPRMMQTIIERTQSILGEETCRAILSPSLRDLPDEYYLEDKKRYAEINDFDRFVDIKRQEFITQLEQIRDEGKLFFNQEITDEVIDFVRADPEISQGVRQGDILYVTKIPYLAKEYLAESNPLMKRYYACHCPWARESILLDDVHVPSSFCQCSGGFHKKPWEIIFGQELQVEVLESALDGDIRCRFAIHLPAGAVNQ